MTGSDTFKLVEEETRQVVMEALMALRDHDDTLRKRYLKVLSRDATEQ